MINELVQADKHADRLGICIRLERFYKNSRENKDYLMKANYKKIQSKGTAKCKGDFGCFACSNTFVIFGYIEIPLKLLSSSTLWNRIL